MLPPERMRLIVPSRWLEGLVQQSLLSKYDITVQHNQIDKSIFRQIDSCFKKNNGLENKTLILSVASKWTERKGLNDVIHLSQVLDLNNYAIVAVGLNKQQIKQAPTSIIALPRTDTVDELVDIYNAADVFFNPTREDNYPTVNLEAEACGTPVITYDTGGCAETICLEQSKVVESFQQAVLAIKNIFDNCVE